MDIAFLFQNGRNPADIFMNGPDLAGERELETSVIISLFTDRRANSDDVYDGDDPMGWWGDSFPTVDGDKIGSRLWELAREKQTNSTLTRAREYCQEALQWMVDDGIASSVIVETEWVQMGFLGISIEVQRPNIPPSKFVFQFAWDQLIKH